MKRSTVLAFAIVCLLMTMLVVARADVAQHEEPQCDLETVIKHQSEHAQELANFEEEAKVDLDAALATLYRTAIAYQALAAECGFANQAGVEAAHQLEHSGIFDNDGDADSTHSEEDEAAELAMARSVGDPEQGKILFNTVRPEVSFACATCHRVDSTETLVGPGLLGIAGHSHNHSDAAAPADDHTDHDSAATPAPTDSMSGMNMGEATAEAPHDEHDAMSGMDMGEATAEASHDEHDSTSEATAEASHDEHDSTSEATAAPEQTMAETVEFLRRSITNPSAEVMTGFPDNLMPKVYGDIFTEEQINDLIAYLLTLD